MLTNVCAVDEEKILEMWTGRRGRKGREGEFERRRGEGKEGRRGGGKTKDRGARGWKERVGERIKEEKAAVARKTVKGKS